MSDEQDQMNNLRAEIDKLVGSGAKFYDASKTVRSLDGVSRLQFAMPASRASHGQSHRLSQSGPPRFLVSFNFLIRPEFLDIDLCNLIRHDLCAKVRAGQHEDMFRQVGNLEVFKSQRNYVAVQAIFSSVNYWWLEDRISEPRNALCELLGNITDRIYTVRSELGDRPFRVPLQIGKDGYLKFISQHRHLADRTFPLSEIVLPADAGLTWLIPIMIKEEATWFPQHADEGAQVGQDWSSAPAEDKYDFCWNRGGQPTKIMLFEPANRDGSNAQRGASILADLRFVATVTPESILTNPAVSKFAEVDARRLARMGRKPLLQTLPLVANEYWTPNPRWAKVYRYWQRISRDNQAASRLGLSPHPFSASSSDALDMWRVRL